MENPKAHARATGRKTIAVQKFCRSVGNRAIRCMDGVFMRTFGARFRATLTPGCVATLLTRG